MRDKIIDCITFFDNDFMFDLRYNILYDVVDFFVICSLNLIIEIIKKKLILKS